MSDKEIPAREIWRRARTGLFAAAAFSLAINLLMLSVPLYTMMVYDRVLSSGSTDTLLFLSLIVAMLLAVFGVLEAVRSRLLARVAFWVENAAGPELLQKMLDARLTGQKGAERAFAHLAGVRSFVSGPAITAIFDAPLTPLFLLVVAALHPMLGVVAGGGAVLLLALAIVNDLVTRRQLAAAGNACSEAGDLVACGFRNAEAVDGMGIIEALQTRWRLQSVTATEAMTRASDRAGMLTAMSRSLRLGVQVAILGAGAVLVLDSAITAGAMVAASLISARALAPIDQMIAGWRQAASGWRSFKAVRQMLATPDRRGGVMDLPPPASGHLIVENLCYGHPGAGKPILEDVSFSVPPGRALAVLGPTAAGKSTLAKLLVGVDRPRSGAVRLDGADVFTWPRREFGRYVGYLPQDVELFGETVSEAIGRLGEPDPKRVVAAARRADAHEMILRLPSGYMTPLGEGASHLSSGQKQRIAFARALYGTPRLVVLDEPNSNLDGPGEAALIRSINNLKKTGASIVLFGHRASTLAAVDDILVLRDGRVQMFGARDEVVTSIRSAAEKPRLGNGANVRNWRLKPPSHATT